MQKVELRGVVVLAEIQVRPGRRMVERRMVRKLLAWEELTLVAQVVLAVRLDIAANCVLPCVFCLPEFDNIFGCARWSVVGDGVHGIQTGNVNRRDLDCTEK